LGHLYNRLFQASRDERFRDRAVSWFEWTLARRRKGEGVGGFRTFGAGSDGQLTWVDRADFLQGSAGIGLALLAALTPIEPAWDRSMLLSSRSFPRSAPPPEAREDRSLVATVE